MANNYALRVLALGIAVTAFLTAQIKSDPADLLAQARNKAIGRLPPLGFSCTETIDRSCFLVNRPSLHSESCEEIYRDRGKHARYKLKLDKADRLRLEVLTTKDGELFLWTGPETFSRSVQEILQPGHFGTGGLGGHLRTILTDPMVRFRLLRQSDQQDDFGFRVPVEGSRYYVKTDSGLRGTGYEGSLTMDSSSLAVKRLTIETEQLLPDTSMCSSSMTITYPTGGTGTLVPSSVRIVDLDRDSSETEWDGTFSDCQSTPETTEEKSHAPLFPSSWAVPMKLVLVSPIDTATAAAGDVVRAKLAAKIPAPSSEMTVPEGSLLDGRIMAMEHYPHKRGSLNRARSFFMIRIDFDTIIVDGSAFSIRAHLTCAPSLNGAHGCSSSATMSDQKRDRAFLFETPGPEANVVVPAGYESTWLTGEVVPR